MHYQLALLDGHIIGMIGLHLQFHLPPCEVDR
jgi:hypothetical protein